MVREKLQNPEVQKPLKFAIDLGDAFEDDLLDPKEFVDYLRSNLKINGKKGNLAEDVTISSEKDKVKVLSKLRISKRYLKYLTKKYLKKSDILEYLKVIANEKNSYVIKYIKLAEAEEGKEEAEEEEATN